MRSFLPLVLSVPVVFVLLAPSAASQAVTFVDEAEELGLDGAGFGRGAGWVDLDRDGLYDLVDTSAGEATILWRRDSDGTYEDVTAAWGVAPTTGETWGVLAADLDNDGDPDLAFPTGGFGGFEPNRLLRNDLAESGTFTDIGPTAGDFEGGAATFGGTVFDYDLDGDLDVFFTNMRFAGSVAHCTLLRNDLELGAGLVFTDVSAAAGVDLPGAYLHCSAGDFDNDGLMDVGVGQTTGPNRLYRNNGDGTFTDVAPAVGITSPLNNFGFVLEDFDNDGWLDVYLPKYQIAPTGPSQLFMNDGSGNFLDVTEGSGLTGQTDMGHNTADLDADGYPDIYVGTGSPQQLDDDVLFLVRPTPGGLQALDVSAQSGIRSEEPTRLHGIVFADDDGDGDLDVFANNGGPSSIQSTAQRDFFWRNQGNGAHWLAIDLLGRVSNPDAIGARVAVLLPDGERVFRRRSVGRGFANTDAPTLHFGLGDEDQPVALEVDWPSGIRQVLPLATVDLRFAVAEAGLLLSAAPQAGGSFTVLAVGAPGGQVTFSIDTDAPAPPAGTRNAIGHQLPGSGQALGASGILPVTFPVPAGSAGETWTIGATLTTAGGSQLTAVPLIVTLP